MGKPYQAELGMLDATTAQMLEVDVQPLRRAVEDAAAHGLVIVASGGSQTAALYLAHLHQMRFGHPCRVMTPLMFGAAPELAGAPVWLLSAGGRNEDILGAARHAIASGAHSITGLIASTATPLEALLKTSGASRAFSYALDSGADGFLATNSLWSMCLLMERAYLDVSEPDAEGDLAQAASIALDWAPHGVRQVDHWDGTLVGLGDPETLIGLQDLEMRATEAALASIWVSDLRNLGHGRHYWFEAHRASSRAVCLYSPPYAGLATRTLELLATVSPTHAIEVPGMGTVARLGAIAWSMHAAHALGARIGRDPGRPGVPAFGEALYGLRHAPKDPGPTRHPDDDEVIGAKLGQGADRIGPEARPEWLRHLGIFRAHLAASEVRAIVADFDGTLIDTASRYEPIRPEIATHLTRLLEAGVPIGIATGRGDSCGAQLRAALPEALWPRVHVGYHNGATLQTLDVKFVPDCPGTPAAPEIEEVYRRLHALVVGSRRVGRVRRYPTQCSMTLLDGSTLEQAWTRAHAALEDLVTAGLVRIWMSSHSIDVVLGHVSKWTVVSAVAAVANCLPKNVLTLGDRGRWPGNDTELLDHQLSLSSDECSFQPDRCWNLAGLRMRQVAATCFHLERLVVEAPGIVRYQEVEGE